jgi:hypothetical protein
VHEFVIRLLPKGSNTVLVTRRFPTSTLSTDFTGLAPGSYMVIAQELNDSGLGAGLESEAQIVAAPSPTPPSPTPTPDPTPTATAAS